LEKEGDRRFIDWGGGGKEAATPEPETSGNSMEEEEDTPYPHSEQRVRRRLLGASLRVIEK